MTWSGNYPKFLLSYSLKFIQKNYLNVFYISFSQPIDYLNCFKLYINVNASTESIILLVEGLVLTWNEFNWIDIQRNHI